MTRGATEAACRSHIAESRRTHGASFGSAAARAAADVIEATRPVDAALDAFQVAWAAPDVAAMTEAQSRGLDAWSALFAAAVGFDTRCPDSPDPLAEFVRVLARTHSDFWALHIAEVPPMLAARRALVTAPA